MEKKKLAEILYKHTLWLKGEPGGERADFSGENLSGENLSNVDLRYADFRGADLSYADLYYANLRGAIFINANLSYADLGCTDLSYANLRGANLKCSDLCYANLNDTRLDSNEELRKGIIVKRKMIGWKKCRDNTIVKLEIPKGAIVFSINNYKCRTNVAKVVEVIGGNGKKTKSFFDCYFAYEKGKTVHVDNFCCEYNKECESGIHFFRTYKEAKNYSHQ